MARKPAQTKAEDKAKDATEAAKPEDTGADLTAADAGATGNTDTQGGNGAASAADTPEHAQGADDPGQTGGEEGSVLPAEQPAGESAGYTEIATQRTGTLVVTEEPVVLTGNAVSETDWIVTCHREGGRRRAGRRWPQGETRAEAGTLSAYDLAILNGDPQFTVRPAAQD